MKKNLFLNFFIFANLVTLEQLIKLGVTSLFSKNPEIFKTSVFSNLLRLTFVENKGIAFGFLKSFSSKTLCLIILTGICIFFSIFFKKFFLTNLNISSILILAGGTSNLIDRLFRGFVLDYIKLSFFPPAFNLADMYIFFGSIHISYCLAFHKKQQT